MRRTKYLPVLVFVFGLLYLLFYMGAHKSAYGNMRCAGSGKAYECTGYGSCPSSGPSKGTCSFSTPNCESTPTLDVSCSGDAVNTCVRANRAGLGCIQTEDDSCRTQTAALDLTNKDCRWYDTDPASGCRSFGTSCSSGLQCCSGTCKAGKCAKTTCAGAGENPSEYALSCCTGLNILDGKCQAVCTKPSPPTDITLRGGVSGSICPKKRVIEWTGIPTGKESALRVDKPPLDLDPDKGTLICNKPAGKDHAGDECWEGPPKEWAYNFDSAGLYQVWVHSYSRTCGSFSNSVSAFFNVSDQPGTPGKLKVGGKSGDPITLNPGSYEIKWTHPANFDNNTRYTLYVNDLANDFDSTCETINQGDTCRLMLSETSYTRNFTSGHTYNIRVYSNSSCSAYGRSDNYRSTQVIIPCTASNPTAPRNIGVVEGDANGGSIIQTRDIKISWSAPSSWGNACGSQNNRYHLKILKSSNNQLIYDKDNIGSGTTSWNTANQSSPPKRPLITNQKYRFVVCSRNKTGGTEVCDSIDKNKESYERATLTGPLSEYDRNASSNKCTGAISSALNSLDITASNSTNTLKATADCSTSTTDTFSCNFNIDNEIPATSPDPDPSDNYRYNLTFTYPAQYDRVYRDDTPNYPVCSGAIIDSPPINITGIEIDKNTPDDPNNPNDQNIQEIGLYFETLSSFFKLKNTSFMSRSGIGMKFPSIISKFQETDPDDTNEAFFNMGDSIADYKGVGTVISSSGISYGPNGSTSSKMWEKTGYGSINTKSFYEIASYIKKKSYTSITSLNELTDNGIYVIDDSVTISDTAFFNGKNIILLVNGTVTIANNFTPNKSVAIIASDISIGSDVENLRALFAADKIILGGGATPLKSVGNITSLSSDGVTGHRVRTDDTSRPSELFVFDPSLYINLLPYLSVSPYEWRQLQ